MKFIHLFRCNIPFGASKQLLRVMRIFIVLMTVFLIQVSAATKAQQLTIKGERLSLREVITQIRKQTGYTILAKSAIVNRVQNLNLDLKNVALEDGLKQILKPKNLEYSIREKAIFIKEVEKSLSISTIDRFIQIDVHGTVTDEKGQPLVGASVKEKGSNKVAVTNARGEFFIRDVDEFAVLEISYLGFQEKEIRVKDLSAGATIILKELIESLDETIIQAYGTTTRRLNTGNISKVSSAEIERQPVGNVLAALDGRVPGMVVTQSMGLAGAAIKVEIRGRTAIDQNLTDDQPLFIVDGVPYGPNNDWLGTQNSALGSPSKIAVGYQKGGASPFNNINPKDIASIEVLKDADATAIYGSRGANGVVIITTKKGVSGVTKVDFNTSTGIGAVPNQVEMLDNKGYAAMRKQAFLSDAAVPTNSNAYDFLVWDTTRNTNFTKMLTGNLARTYDNQLSLSSGNDRTQFLISGNYRKETSIMPGDFADKKGGLHFNVNHSNTDKKFNMIFSGTYNLETNRLPLGDPMGSVFSNIPNMKVYETDGSLAWGEGGYIVNNPLGYLNQKYQSNTSTLIGNLQLNYSLFKGAKFLTNLGYNQIQMDENTQNPAAAQNPSYGFYRETYENVNRFKSWIVEPQLEYGHQLGESTVNVLLGGSWQQTDNDGTSLRASGYSSDDLMSSVASATGFINANWKSQYRYQAVFGRINYNIKDTYLFNLSARRDGSSRFGEGEKFANFGALGVAWIFSNENWVKNQLNFLGFGKIRASYGITGNDKITNYQYLDTWMATTSTYYGIGGLYPNKLFNPDYRWEKTTKLEGAIDMGFFNDQVLLSVALYLNQSANQLVNYKLPSITGFSTVVANLPAKVENQGLEISLNTTTIKNKKFSWSSSFNITLPKNRLVSFPNLALSSYANTYIEGEPLNLIRAYEYLGVDQQTGLYTFRDFDGNTLLDSRDMVALGNTDPIAYGGLQNSFTYKSLQLDVFFSFRKQTGRNYLASLPQRPGQRGYNLPAEMTDFWTYPGQEATFQRLSMGNANALTAWNNFQSSNGIYSDASFIRLKNIQLAYRFEGASVARLGINNARIYVQGQNLLTITGYEIGDPEIQFLTRTPPLRVFAIGAQFTF